MNSPKHIAIIMDGNGRWGLRKNKTRNYGHTQGVKTVEKIIEASASNNIKYLTLYTFSTENWKRPKKEIFFLIYLLEKYLDKKFNKLLEKNIKLNVFGNINKFPNSLRKKLKKAQKISNKNNKIQINLALNYGSKEEIIDACKKISKMKVINIKNFEQNLYTKNIPNPDILIRTGGTMRLSNFLLWQLAYTEIFFLKTMWPDFGEKDFNQVLNKFNKIKRNYGKI